MGEPAWGVTLCKALQHAQHINNPRDHGPFLDESC